jgi:hypothetical protein
MANYIIVEGSGRRIPVPHDLAANDQAIVEALRPFYPEAGESEITRETDADGDTLIRVVPQGKTKGRGAVAATALILAELAQAPRFVQPAVALCLEIDARGPAAESLFERAGEIESALETVGDALDCTRSVAERLRRAPAVPALSVPLGF